VAATKTGEELEQTGRTQYQQLNNLLMQLRKVCMHPFMFDGAEGSDIELTTKDELVAASGKLQILERLLVKLHAAGNRVVLFSQFTSMLDILEESEHRQFIDTTMCV
jgi:SWI/SNF-related matrix-associated actin-dependent regulator of chromatin subfamily A member 5